MSRRRYLSRSICRAIVAALLVALLSGCDAYLPGPSYEDVKIPEEKLRQIETLELEEAEPEPNTVEMADANEVPPAELELSLEQCRALALSNNLELKASLIDPTIAAERLSEEEAKFEASFFANGTLSKSDQPGRVGLIDGSPITLPPSRTKRGAADLGVQVPLRTGGTVRFDMSDSRYNDLTGDPNFYPTFDNRFTASLSQPLLAKRGQMGKHALHPSCRV